MTNLTCTAKYDKAHYIPDYIRDLVDEWQPVGSRETCNPPPTDTDQDVLILTEGRRYHMLREELSANNWDRQFGDGYENLPSSFVSYKQKHEDGTLVNLILTSDISWFEKFMQAHFSCKEKNLLNKKDRIVEFKKFLPQPEAKGSYDDCQKALLKKAQSKSQQVAYNYAFTVGTIYTSPTGVFGNGGNNW